LELDEIYKEYIETNRARVQPDSFVTAELHPEYPTTSVTVSHGICVKL